MGCVVQKPTDRPEEHQAKMELVTHKVGRAAT
jgi:hypothetical protein